VSLLTARLAPSESSETTLGEGVPCSLSRDDGVGDAALSASPELSSGSSATPRSVDCASASERSCAGADQNDHRPAVDRRALL